MARNSNNALVLSDGFVYVAPVNSTMPTDVTTALDAVFKDLGWLGDSGFGETRNVNTTPKYGINGALIRNIKSNDTRKFTFECYERNATVLGLARPGSSGSTSSATAEVQTVTISGSPTGGTFTLTVPGYGDTGAQAYNVSTTALASALSSLIGQTVTVTGTAGTSYVVTFPSSLGNVGMMTATASFTGGTTPAIAVAETTPGVAGVTTSHVKAYTGTDLRAFVIESEFGSYTRRVCILTGEATQTGTLTDARNDLTVFQFEVECYPQSDGTLYVDITNNPAESVA